MRPNTKENSENKQKCQYNDETIISQLFKFFYIYICCFMVVVWGLSCKPITLILYSNFEVFVTVVTGPVGLRQITLRS